MALTKEQIRQIAEQTRNSIECGACVPAGGGQCLFDDVHDAINTAIRAQERLMEMSLEQRGKLIEAMRAAARANVQELATLAHEETGYGKIHHKIAKNLLAADKTPGIEDLHPTDPLPGPNHTLFICPGGGGRIDFRYGEAPAENRPAGGSDRLSGGILSHRPGGGRPRPNRGPVHRPLHRHGRRHPGPARPALSHPGGGPGPPAAKKGGAPAASAPKLPLAQRAGVGVLRLKTKVFNLSDINPCWICDMPPLGARYIFDAIYPAGCEGFISYRIVARSDDISRFHTPWKHIAPRSGISQNQTSFTLENTLLPHSDPNSSFTAATGTTCRCGSAKNNEGQSKRTL